MNQIKSVFRISPGGNPAGGSTTGPGLVVQWLGAPVGDGSVPTGAQVEDLIEAAISRLEFFQAASKGKFACPENAAAIEHLTLALGALHARTAARARRGVEGTAEP